MQKFGQTECNRRVAESIIKIGFRKKEQTLTLKTRFVEKSAPQPTLSQNANPKPDANTETAPLLAKDRLEAKYQYYKMGVDHFEKRFVYGLADDVRADAANWMRKVLRQLPITDCYRQWTVLNEEANKIAARSEELETEPMFCMCRGIAAGEAIGEHACTKWFATAMAEFRVSDYPTRIAIMCYHFDSDYTPNLKSGDIDYHVAVGAVFHWLENDFRATGHEQRFVLETFNRTLRWILVAKDYELLTALEESIAHSNQLSPWMKSMLRGRINYRKGYSYRGSGWANTVSDEGWEKFEQYASAAHEHFEEAYRLRPEFPESATELIVIARNGYADQDEDYWFEKSIEYEPDYLPAYDNRVFGLYPRWGGSTEKMVDFVLSKAQDTDSSSVAFLLPREIFKWRTNGEFKVDQWEEMITTPKVNEEALAALDKIISKEESIVIEDKIYSPEFFRTLKAIFAAKAENYEVSEATFEELGDKFSNEAIKRMVYGMSSFNSMRSSVYAFTSEYQADAKKLKELWGNNYKQRHENADEILALTDGLAQWVNTHSGGLYFKSAREKLLAELNFFKMPLKMTFDKDFLLWSSNDFSQVKFVSPETVRIDNRSNNAKFNLRTSPRLMAPRVFECDIKFPQWEADGVEPSSEKPNQIAKKSETTSKSTASKTPAVDTINQFRPSVAVGLVKKQYFLVGIGPVEKSLRRKNGRSYNGVLTFGPDYSRDKLIKFSVNLNKGQNRLKIAFGIHYVEVYLNNQFIFRSFSKRFDWCQQIVLEQPYAMQGRGVVEFSNLTVSAWKQGPPPTLSGDTQGLIKYYEKAIELEPENAWANFWLGQAKHMAEDFEGAIPLYEQAIAAGVSPRFAGFFIGDACDRVGRYDDAISWYKKAGDSAAPAYPIIQSGGGVYDISEPEEHARFRLQWLLATKGKLTDTELETLKNTGSGNIHLSGPGRWLSTIGFNLASARKRDNDKQDNYKRTLESIERHLDFRKKSKDKQVDNHRETLQPVLYALKAETAYVRPKNEPPIYLKYKNDEIFFQHFERAYLPKYAGRRFFYEPLEEVTTGDNASEAR